MGFKRPFEDGYFQEFSFKHPKQVNLPESHPCLELTQTSHIPVDHDGLYCKLQWSDHLEDDIKNEVSHLTEKEVEISAPYSWVTSSSSEEDAGSSAAVCSSFSQEYLEFYFPRKSIVQSEDTYSSLLDGSPISHVPIGPNHQAEVPAWNRQAMEKCCLGSDHINYDCGEKFMGDCVILMPDREFSYQSGVRAGGGRKDCTCPDQGSVRCVQYHVREARDRLRVALGPEKFVKLGFCDMGEDIKQMWTEEEERVFHEVVYSNPVSRGKNFWEHLSAMFPSRTKKEIVSYYFNVFILQRRSVQNGSNFLDVDSDDDEWNVSYGGPLGYSQEDDEDSANASPLVNEDIQVNYRDDLPCSNKDDQDDDKHHAKVSLHGNCAGSADGLDPGYLLEPCNGKVWDHSFPMSPLRFNDFLSTGKMIEELFGSSPDGQ